MIKEYLALAQKLDEQTQNAILIMVECLRKTSLSLRGVETRPGKSFALEPAWTDPKILLPEESEIVEVLLLNQAAKENSHHPGFGTGYWIDQCKILGNSNIFLIECVQTVHVTHWRPLPLPEFSDNVAESIKEIVREMGQLGVDGKLETEKMEELRLRMDAATLPNGGENE